MKDLLDSGESFTPAAKLRASAEELAKREPELHEFVYDMVERAGDLLGTSIG
jgi:hypothetical protein